MILHGMNARILADDVPALYDFYTGVLGLKTVWGDRNSTYVSFSEAEGDKPILEVFARSGMKDYKGYAPLPGGAKTDSVICCTGADDVDACYNELKTKGVELVGEPQTIEAWYMRCFYFRDPEGNLFEVSRGIG